MQSCELARDPPSEPLGGHLGGLDDGFDNESQESAEEGPQSEPSDQDIGHGAAEKLSPLVRFDGRVEKSDDRPCEKPFDVPSAHVLAKRVEVVVHSLEARLRVLKERKEVKEQKGEAFIVHAPQ